MFEYSVLTLFSFREMESVRSELRCSRSAPNDRGIDLPMG
jgi:hypothetical protein